MSLSTEKSEYLLLFRGTQWHDDLSPEEIQQTMLTWMSWFDRLVEEGRCKGGQSLAVEGRVVAAKSQQISDGPFVESKESIAGFFVLNVDDIEEAVAIARDCPALVYGMTVEVRPLMLRCASSQAVLDELLAARA